uniref:large ribosomal subunit protein uL1m isoform X2 n=1 Tax=Myxine glutinosa TaxID=7769 RepID=UPI00358F3DF2
MTSFGKMAAPVRFTVRAVPLLYSWSAFLSGHRELALSAACWRKRIVQSARRKKTLKEPKKGYYAQWLEAKHKAAEEERKTGCRRPKPFGLSAWEPKDDVYIYRYYPRPTYQPLTALNMLRQYQQLDSTEPDQLLYMRLKLNLEEDVKKKLDAKRTTIDYPYPFKNESNSIIFFTEDANEKEKAKKLGLVTGGLELIEKILNDEVQSDYYMASPDILEKLLPLKEKLQKKFPSTKRGMVGNAIESMVEYYNYCSDFTLYEDSVSTSFARLDMSDEHLFANMKTFMGDILKVKALKHGSSIEYAYLSSETSEGLSIHIGEFLSKSSK